MGDRLGDEMYQNLIRDVYIDYTRYLNEQQK